MIEQQMQQAADIKLMMPSSLQKGNAVEGVFCTGEQSVLGQKNQLHLTCITLQ